MFQNKYLSFFLIWILLVVFVSLSYISSFSQNIISDKNFDKINISNPLNSGKKDTAHSDEEDIKKEESDLTGLEETYIASKIITVSWGNRENQIGIHNPSEKESGDLGENYGPQSFDIDKSGHIYILDTVNARVIQYNQNGIYLNNFLIANITPDDIRVHGDKIYIFDYGTHAIFKYTISGKLLNKYTIPKEIDEPYKGINIDYVGNLMIEKREKTGGQTISRFFQISEKGTKNKTNNYIGHQAKNCIDYFLFSPKESTPLKSVINILNHEGVLKKKIILRLPEFKNNDEHYVYFYGLDDETNIYLKVAYENLRKRGWEEIILKYTVGGELMALVNLTAPIEINGEVPSPYTLPFVRHRIMANGDIYYMFPLKHVFQIIKYAKNKR